MTPVRILLLAAVGIASLTSPVSAQAPTDSTLTDSVAAAPARKGGGLFGKIKKAASNKTVQGIAKGVACTAVPGAAAVSAATGSGTCPAGLAGGMPGSGGVAGAAAGAAVGAMGGMEAPAAGVGGMIPNGGALPVMSGMAATAGTAGMTAAMARASAMPPGMKINEDAAAKCMGLTLQEYRDVSSPASDAATLRRAEAVQLKLARGGGKPADMEACGNMQR